MGAKIYNSDLTKQIIEGAKLQQSQGQIPSEIAEKVVPVMEVNPKLLKRTNFIRETLSTNATTTTMFTSDTDKETYISTVYLNFIRDVTATSTNFWVQIIDEFNTAKRILRIPGITLTAGSGQISLTFPNPILIAKQSIVTIQSDTNVGNFVLTAGISGYIDNNITA